MHQEKETTQAENTIQTSIRSIEVLLLCRDLSAGKLNFMNAMLQTL